MGLFKEIGFADTKPVKPILIFGMELGTAPAANYTQLVQKRSIDFGDFRVNYSVIRAFAVDFGYSALSKYIVEGYKYLPIIRGAESYFSEIYLTENFSGNFYCLHFSLMPVPDNFLKKTSFYWMPASD